jgi:hypothetical protein
VWIYTYSPTERVGVVIALCTRVLEVLVSNLGRNADCVIRRMPNFYSYLPLICRIIVLRSSATNSVINRAVL